MYLSTKESFLLLKNAPRRSANLPSPAIKSTWHRCTCHHNCSSSFWSSLSSLCPVLDMNLKNVIRSDDAVAVAACYGWFVTTSINTAAISHWDAYQPFRLEMGERVDTIGRYVVQPFWTANPAGIGSPLGRLLHGNRSGVLLNIFLEALVVQVSIQSETSQFTSIACLWMLILVSSMLLTAMLFLTWLRINDFDSLAGCSWWIAGSPSSLIAEACASFGCFV